MFVVYFNESNGWERHDFSFSHLSLAQQFAKDSDLPYFIVNTNKPGIVERKLPDIYLEG